MPEFQTKSAARLSIEIRGDEAIVSVDVEAGAPDPTPLLEAAKHATEVLAEKRLAWWNPV
jgi:hypothetical protein